MQAMQASIFPPSLDPSSLCVSCQDPLVLSIEPDSDLEEEEAEEKDAEKFLKSTGQSTPSSSVAGVLDAFPDDVELGCGCHFHWECFLEAYSVTECPNCTRPLSTMNDRGEQQVLCTVRNEGGVQENFDILPSATDEAYLRTYPEERRGYAYLDFCRVGDVDALIHIFRDEGAMKEGEEGDEEEEVETQQPSLDILRYTGSFEGIDGSGLHVAVRNNQQDVAWLLLLLGSSLDWSKFPPRVLQAMQNVGLSQDDRNRNTAGKLDVRTLKDSEGKTAADLANAIGSIWLDWTTSGRLHSPT